MEKRFFIKCWIEHFVHNQGRLKDVGNIGHVSLKADPRKVLISNIEGSM